MKKPGEQPIPRCSSKLQEIIRDEIQNLRDIPEPDRGDGTRRQVILAMGQEHRKIILRLLAECLKEHSDWQQRKRPKLGKTEDYFPMSKVIEEIRPRLNHILSLDEPHQGEKTLQSSARLITDSLRLRFPKEKISSISDHTLRKAVEVFFTGTPRDGKYYIQERRTPDGNHYPHLSPKLIDALKKKFESTYRTPTPRPGEITKQRAIKLICEKTSIGKEKASTILTSLTEENPGLTVPRRRPGDSYVSDYYREDLISSALERKKE